MGSDICVRQRAIKYAVYPTPEQESIIQKTFGCCRFVWNHMLGDEQTFYAATDRHFIVTPAHYKTEYPFLREVDSLALCNEQLALQKAFAGFFSKNASYPRFKSKKKPERSYTTNKVGNNLSLEKDAIRLPKLGAVRAKIHRRPELGWKLKGATISQTASGRYFCSLLFEYKAVVPQSKPVVTEKAVGLDYSSPKFYVDSNGSSPGVPHWFRESEEKLARMQRRLSRMKEGSKHYIAQKQKIAELQEHIAFQRQDFAHKERRRITNAYDIVCVEDVDLKAMAQLLSLGKSTMDNGFGRFRGFLGYKLAEKGKHLVFVDKWYPSSKTCHQCGYVNKALGLGDRVWVCPNCGTIIDRDTNAALNIRDEGIRILLSRSAVA